MLIPIMSEFGTFDFTVIITVVVVLVARFCSKRK